MLRLGFRQAIGGQLIKHELIVGQIFVQRADHPIAIGVRPGKALRGVYRVVHRIGITRHVQPVTSPSLAISW